MSLSIRKCTRASSMSFLLVIVGSFSNGTGTSFDDGKAHGKD